MNLLSFLLSLLFSFVSPATTSSEAFDSRSTKISKYENDGGKKDKFKDGEFIIVNDTNP